MAQSAQVSTPRSLRTAGIPCVFADGTSLAPRPPARPTRWSGLGVWQGASGADTLVVLGLLCFLGRFRRKVGHSV
jgi:hypothetical protein